jgi:hypothetical protein
MIYKINTTTNIQDSYISSQNILNPAISSPSQTIEEKSDNVTRYDFADISREDLRNTVNELIKNGQLNLDETSSLVPLMYMQSGQLDTNQINYDSQKIDAYSEIKKSLAYNEYSNNHSGIIYDNK